MNHPKIRTDEQGDLHLNLGEYGHEVEVACFSGDGRRLLAVQEVGVARVWDIDSGQKVGEIRPDSSLAGKKGVGPASGPFLVFIEAAALDSTGDTALLGLNDGTAGLFRVADGSRRTTFHHPDRPPTRHWELIRAVNFSPDGILAVVGFFGRCVGVWDVRDGRQVVFLRSDLGGRLHRPAGWARDTLVSSVAVSADSRFVFAGHADMTATLWDLTTGRVVQDAFEHQEEVLALWHGDGAVRWATSGGVVWEAASRLPSPCLRTGESWQETVFAPDGRSLLARTGDGRVLRQPLAGQAMCVARLDMGKGGIGWASSARTLAFAPGGRAWLYPVARDELALADPSGVQPLRCNVQSILTTFSADGRLLATYGENRLRVWAVPSGEPLGELHDAGTFWAAAFSPDGSLLATGTLGQVTARNLGPARTITLWDVAGRRLLCRWPAHEHQVHRVAFTPDGRQLASASLDRTVRLWRLAGREDERPVEAGRLQYDDLVHEHLAVLSDGRIVVFRSGVIEVWRGLREKTAELSAGLSFGDRWLVSADEKLLLIARDRQAVEVWGLESGTPVARHAAEVTRPEVLPGPGLLRGRAVAGGYLWRTSAGNFIHVGDGPRGWAIPLRLSADGKHVVLPCQDRAALVALEPRPRVVAEFPFEGAMRGSCITADRILAVNAAGKVFAARRDA